VVLADRFPGKEAFTPSLASKVKKKQSPFKSGRFWWEMWPNKLSRDYSTVEGHGKGGVRNVGAPKSRYLEVSKAAYGKCVCCAAALRGGGVVEHADDSILDGSAYSKTMVFGDWTSGPPCVTEGSVFSGGLFVIEQTLAR